MPDEFDIVVIGGGPTGEHFASRARAEGLSVAIVEEELVGGECSYWACMPSKTLLRPTQALHDVQRVPGAREAVSGSVDVEASLARRDWMTSDWHDDGQVAWLESVGVALVRGHGRLAGVRTVAVTQPDASTRTLVAGRAVVVAVGSSAAVPPIEGLADAMAWTNREITAAKKAPARLVVIGGGAVGVEMAQAWRRLGSREVTIVESADRLLAMAEPFASAQLTRALVDEQIAVRTGARVVAVRRASPTEPVVVELDGGDHIEGDEVLVAVGRRARTDDLGLETVGLAPGRAIPVDDTLRAEGVDGGWLYVIGDANGRALLTHMGKYQARIVARALRGDNVVAESDHRAISSVVFTAPQVAAVGLTEAQAVELGLSVRTLVVELGSVAASSIWGDGLSGTCQLVVDAARGVIVGATFVGPDVAELLHAATIAIVGEVPLSRLRHAVAAFPTLSEIWLELVEQYDADELSPANLG